jgi:NAD(P)H dehydrogenase (quinone)
MLVPLLHHGMVIAGIPYSERALSETRSGGTPYGATHVTPHGQAVQLSEHERVLARAQGERIATLARALKIRRG